MLLVRSCDPPAAPSWPVAGELDPLRCCGTDEVDDLRLLPKKKDMNAQAAFG